MLYKVYKSLDKTNSLFGIKGSYQRYALFGVAGGVILGLVVGMAAGGLLGTLTAIGAGVGVYVAILSIQSKFSERERTKWFCSHKLPDCITVPPRPLRRYCKIRSSSKNKGGKKSINQGRYVSSHD